MDFGGGGWNGVEIEVGRSFNYYAAGPSCYEYTCALCHEKISAFTEPFSDSIFDAALEWMKGSDTVTVVCPHCAGATFVTEWPCEPPLGFGNLSIKFWNWPLLDLPNRWKLDIIGLVREITGHSIVQTWGKI